MSVLKNLTFIQVFKNNLSFIDPGPILGKFYPVFTFNSCMLSYPDFLNILSYVDLLDLYNLYYGYCPLSDIILVQ
jgi:hypothetical protein